LKSIKLGFEVISHLNEALKACEKLQESRENSIKSFNDLLEFELINIEAAVKSNGKWITERSRLQRQLERFHSFLFSNWTASEIRTHLIEKLKRRRLKKSR
jgi:hypothetical protein